MARPRSNEKVIKYLEGSLRDVESMIDSAVLVQDFKAAVTLKSWKTCILTAIDMIKVEPNGKQNKAIKKLTDEDIINKYNQETQGKYK